MVLIGMPELKEDPFVGKPAPDFCLPDAQGTSFCLNTFRGKWVVLYFYPRDNTPGCTIEAMQFNAALEKFVRSWGTGHRCKHRFAGKPPEVCR